MKRMALLLAIVLAGCGGGSPEAGDAGTVPSRPSTTLAPTTGGGSATETTTVALYFTRGERVERVARDIPKVSRVGAEAVKALVAGPTAEERRAGLDTAIPTDTRFNGLTITDEVARVDLSRTFESGGGSLGLTLRLAQVVCTLDAFPTVSGVRLALDGQLVDVLSGDGIVVDKPVSCGSYAEYVGEAPAQPPATPLFAGIWPFANAAELEAYAGSGEQAFRDPSTVARAFAETFLGIGGAVVFPFRSTGTRAGEVPFAFGRGEGGRTIPDPQPATVIQVRQLGRTGATGPWTVTGATSPDIEVDVPRTGATVTSPVSLAGRARAFEGNVVVEVREDGMVFGQSLGRTFVTGRGDGVLGPFTGSATFRKPSKPAGAVVFYEPSSAEGGSAVLRAAVVRVGFAT